MNALEPITANAIQANEGLLIDSKAVARLLSVSKRHVEKMNCSGELGPAAIKLGRCCRWRRSEILRWIEAGCPARARWLAMQARPGLRLAGGYR